MTDQSRDGADVRLPPPLLPMATVLGGVGLQRTWPLPNGLYPSVPLRCWLGGGLAVVSVLGLGLWAVVLLRRSGQSEIPWRPTPSIVERGPFRFSRNPMYLHMLLVCVGCSILLANPWILLLTPVCALLLYWFAIRPEEAYLERKFGEAYLAYKRRVRRWL